MEFTSHNVAQIRFTERGVGYDRQEVDEFRAQVRRALAKYEQAVHDLDRAPALRAQLAAGAEGARSKPGALPARSDSNEVAVLRARVQDLERQLAEAAVAAREQGVAEPGATLNGGRSAEDILGAAVEEASRILAAASSEGETLVAAAQQRADSLDAGLRDETRRVTQRLARLRTAVTDVEARFRGLVASTLEELSLVRDLIDLETSALTEIESLRTDSPWRNAPAPLGATEASGRPSGGPEPAGTRADQGFYERRLWGLRNRLGKGGT
jgi:cell division septum initiation protein DivIVA